MRETVARIMIELSSNDLAIQYNMNGQKGKMSFGKLHLANLHNHRSQMSISRNKHISPVTVPYLQHAFPYAHTRFYQLAVTFLCIIHSHSSASDRHRPIRNTLTLGISLLVSTCKPSHLSAQQPSKIHNKLYISLFLIMLDIEINRDRAAPSFRVAYATRRLHPASVVLRATLATSGITPPACTCHQPSTNRSTTSHGTVYHEHVLNCMLPKVKFPPVKGIFEIHSVNL